MTRLDSVTRWAKRRIITSPVPLRYVQETRMEAHLWTVRVRGRIDPRLRRRAAHLRTLDGAKLHFGCGTRILPGWVNVDGWNRRGVDYLCDLRQPLPLKNGSCRLIFTEHVIEHIDSQFRSAVFEELHRILKRGGTLRIVGPDCGQFARAYAGDRVEWFEEAAAEWPTKGEALNQIFLSHFHRFVDDFETLKLALQAAGFSEVVESTHMCSPTPELRIDLELPSRTVSNLYVEGRKT